MKKRVYAVNDSKVEAFMIPFFARADGEAMRIFEDAIKDMNSPMGRYPADFTLFSIGTWDEDTAQFKQDGPPLMLVNGLRLSSSAAPLEVIENEKGTG